MILCKRGTKLLAYMQRYLHVLNSRSPVLGIFAWTHQRGNEFMEMLLNTRAIVESQLT